MKNKIYLEKNKRNNNCNLNASHCVQYFFLIICFGIFNFQSILYLFFLQVNLYLQLLLKITYLIYVSFSLYTLNCIFYYFLVISDNICLSNHFYFVVYIKIMTFLNFIMYTIENA